MTDPTRAISADSHPTQVGRHLFRSFVIASMAAVLVLLLVAGFGLHLVYRKNIIAEAELDAVRITSALNDFQIEQFLRDASLGQRSISEQEMAVLDQRLRTFLRPFHIVKIKIFDTSTEIIYSTDPTIIGKKNKDNPKLVSALSGTPISKFEAKDRVWDLADEERFNVGIVESYVPVSAKNGEVIGSFEIYKDVTQDLVQGRTALVRSVSVLLVVALAVFALLILIMHRASRTILHQTEELGAREEKYRRLFSKVDDAIVIFDRVSGRVTDTNMAAADLYGATEDELHEHTIDELGIRVEQLAGTSVPGGEKTVKCKHIRLDGVSVPVEVSGGSFSTQCREMMFAVVRDTTEEVRAQAERNSALREVERFNSLAVGREHRMIELKEEVNEMALKAGVAPPYDAKTVGA